jgi:GNAT superfamily N-acetyltransferase
VLLWGVIIGAMAIVAARYSDRPELWRETDEISEEVWPEYNLHGAVLGRYWGRLYSELPDFQFVLYDDDRDEVLAEGHTAPTPWDGTVTGLGPGIDEMITAAFGALDTGARSTALCALAAEIRPQFQGLGLASRILDVMSDLARGAELMSLIAPVRPSWKDRYPLTSIERYVEWTREDGQPFDPWIRVHTRRGGVISKPVPESMRISGRVSEWEQWTGMRFPDDGIYTFPSGLAPLHIDHGQDLGSYWEPNVWIVHTVKP